MNVHECTCTWIWFDGMQMHTWGEALAQANFSWSFGFGFGSGSFTLNMFKLNCLEFVLWLIKYGNEYLAKTHCKAKAK